MSKVKLETMETGDPIILVNAEGLTDSGLHDGMKGWCNCITYVDKEYVWFMPLDGKDQYVMTSDRVKVDVEAKEHGLTLNAESLARGEA